MSSPRGHQHSPLKPNPAALCKPQSLMKSSFKLMFPTKKLPGSSLPGGQRDFDHPARQELWDEAPNTNTSG